MAMMLSMFLWAEFCPDIQGTRYFSPVLSLSVHNERVVETNMRLKLIAHSSHFIFFWKHKGFHEPHSRVNFDHGGVHLNVSWG